MTQNAHAYATCCRPEVDDDVIYSQNIKTIEGYVAVNFEVASSSNFQNLPKMSFCDGEVSDGWDCTNAIFSRPEPDDDVISGEDVDTFKHYTRVNL